LKKKNLETNDTGIIKTSAGKFIKERKNGDHDVFEVKLSFQTADEAIKEYLIEHEEDE